MSQWRRQALQELPALKVVVERQPSVMSLWIELLGELTRAYEKAPLNEDLVARLYRYAYWSLAESKDPDAVTAVVVAFYEHLPTEPRVRQDVHRWLSQELFHGLEERFGYFLSPAELDEFKVEFRTRRSAWLGGEPQKGGTGHRTGKRASSHGP
jgi:hypothetical protein